MKPRFASASALAAAAVASLLLLLAPRPASAADVPLAVLGLESTEGAPESVATAITDALRQQVTRARGYKLVAGRDLVEIKLVFACPDEANSCMAEAARNLTAAKIIYGNVKRAGDSYLVTLKLLDATTGKPAYVAEQLPRASASGPALREAAQKWFTALTGQGTGSIVVTADVAGAAIALDGLPVGVTAAGPVTVPGVSAGRHEVVVTKPGLEPVRRTITVTGGEAAELSLQLGAPAAPPSAGAGPGAVAGGPDPATGPGGLDLGGSGDTVDRGEGGGGSLLLKVASWATLGASALAFGLGVKYSLEVQDTNEKLDPFRRYECLPGVYCNKQRMIAPPISDPAQIAQRDDLEDKGRKAETLQYVFYGAGGALLVTSGILLYKAYFAGDTGSERAGTAPRIVVAPTLQPGGLGLGALVRY